MLTALTALTTLAKVFKRVVQLQIILKGLVRGLQVTWLGLGLGLGLALRASCAAYR